MRAEVRDTTGGVVYDDPFRWLEPETPEVLAWQVEQDARAASYVHDWPGWQALLRAVTAELAVASIQVPARRGDRTFCVRHHPGAERPLLEVTADGQTRPLIDLNAAGATLDWWYASPKGTYVAYGISQHGDEQSVLHIVDVASGELLPVTVPHTPQTRLAWLPDESGFYFDCGVAPTTVDGTKYMSFLRVTDDAPERVSDALPMHAGPQVSDDGRYLLLLDYTAVGTWRAIEVMDLHAGRTWRPFAPPGHRQLLGAFDGDRYVAVSKDDAPRGRVVSIPVATAADPTTWTELVPESDAVLQHIHLKAGRIAVEELVDTVSNVRVFEMDGSLVGEAVLPGAGTAAFFGNEADPDGTQIGFVFTSFLQTAGLYSLDVRDLSVTEVQAPKRRLDEVVARLEFAVAEDGERVPLHIIEAKGRDGAPAPTVITGYGGYNHVLPLAYIGRWLPFVRSGGVLVQTHLRGGGEYGADWWERGRMRTKQQTFEDLYAVAEHLADTGVADRGRIGFTGGSNGGLTAGVAAVQRPDLFRAVVPQIPILDLVRAMNDPYTAAAQLMEYGDPNDPEMAPYLLSYSPYHAIEQGTSYTAMMVCCGATDMRCPPWHGRKYVARMQEATTSTRPVLLRIWADIGHGTGTTATTGAMVAAEPVAFFMKEFGMEVA